MGIFPPLEGCLALGSLQMYAVSLENCLQKLISWYIKMWDTDWFIFLVFLVQKFLFKGGRGWKIFHLREKETHILLVRLAFLSHICFKHTLMFHYFHLLNFLLPIPCAYLLLKRYSIHVFHKPELVLFSFSVFIFLSNSSQKPCIILIC